jgi:hypothetical protein
MQKLSQFAQFAIVIGTLILAGALAEKLIRPSDVSIAIALLRQLKL